MTCAHVLGLIDAGPFADYPRAHLDAAWKHAHQCATCRPALEAATALTAGLAALPQLAAPPDLAGAVLARIVQIEHAHPALAAAARPETTTSSSTRDWAAWVTALGGLAAGLAIVLSMPSAYGALVDIASPKVRGITVALVAMPSTTTGALILGSGLVLYVAALFAPLTIRK